MIGEFMFGFGAGGDFPEMKDTKKNTEKVKPEEDLSLGKKITISKEEFMRKAAEVVSSGRFAQMSMERDPMMGALTMMTNSILVSEIVAALFDEEDE